MAGGDRRKASEKREGTYQIRVRNDRSTQGELIDNPQGEEMRVIGLQSREDRLGKRAKEWNGFGLNI